MSSEYLNNKDFEKAIQKFQVFKREKFKYELLLSELIESTQRKSLRSVCNKREKELIPKYETINTQLSIDFEKSRQELATEFYVLSEHIAQYSKFNLIDIDDSIQEGVMICFEKIDRFDASKGKAFNYMTTCILNHFRQLYRTARNYNDLKKKYLDHLQIQVAKKIIKNKKEISINHNA